MNDENALPQILTDDEMDNLVQCNLYEYYGVHDSHATPNFRYCQPSTPGYTYDWEEAVWKVDSLLGVVVEQTC